MTAVRPAAFLEPEEVLDAPRGRRVAVQLEHALQRGVYRWCRRCLPRGAMFVSWDRSAKHSEQQHIREAQRGVLGGWPDSAVLWSGGLLCIELKRPGAKPTARQLHVGQQIQAAGQRWAWADSVAAFAIACFNVDIPLMGNWNATARLQDELVAADIRKQELRAAARRAGAFQPKAIRRHVTPGAVARARRAGAWPV